MTLDVARTENSNNQPIHKPHLSSFYKLIVWPLQKCLSGFSAAAARRQRAAAGCRRLHLRLYLRLRPPSIYCGDIVTLPTRAPSATQAAINARHGAMWDDTQPSCSSSIAPPFKA